MIYGLVDHLWQSTLFCGAVWSITLLLRRNSAALRHALWLAASVKFLVPFSALYFLGAAAGFPVPVETQPVYFGAAVEVTAPVIAPTLTLRTASASASTTLLWIVFAAWLIGALAVAARWLRGWRAADYLTRAARPAPGSLPDARITDADIEPSVARVFHPVVLLPAALLGRLSERQLEAVVAHEREHIARRDNLKAHLHHFVTTLFWFHPLVWWIGRHLVEERERACDEAVVANGHDPGDYAAGILEVCRHCCGHGDSAASAATMSALSGDLTRRIRQILSGARPATMGIVKAFALLGCTLTAAAVPLAAGAMDGAVQRYQSLTNNARRLESAIIYVAPAGAPAADRALEIGISGQTVNIRNASLRQLVAAAYDVQPWDVTGGEDWLDNPRYDIRAEIPEAVDDPDGFDPRALRGLVNKLLASRFDLEIRVHERCQENCDR